MCNEMIKLRQMLNDRGIKWKDFSTVNFHFYIHRTHFTFDGIDYSVINGCGTYGGYAAFDYVNKYVNKGLLELMGGEINGGEPVGWLTAEQVLKEVGVIRD